MEKLHGVHYYVLTLGAVGSYGDETFLSFIKSECTQRAEEFFDGGVLAFVYQDNGFAVGMANGDWYAVGSANVGVV